MQVKKYVVYRHIFPNGKSYIGITCVTPFDRRWRAGSGYINQPKIYNAILKYGWDNIEHVILYENLTLEEANMTEQEMIAKYDSIRNGYNISTGGGGTNGIPCSEETKRKIGVANKGKPAPDPNRLRNYTAKHGAWNKGGHLTTEQYRKISEERKRRCNKEIRAYEPSTHELIRVYESCATAARMLGVSKSVISRCARGNRKTSCGFEWRYSNDLE